ncbi:MAG: hypothetical protein NTU60_10865 [Candidatus Aminicenantes bacterium]|nr:hypothetical protein [Candidatus Aminicenantes bacterium]
MRRALELDPLSVAAAACIGEVLMLARESEAAIDQCRSVIAMDASYWVAHSVLGFAYQQKGQHREAVEVGGAEVIVARRKVIFQTAVPEPWKIKFYGFWADPKRQKVDSVIIPVAPSFSIRYN